MAITTSLVVLAGCSGARVERLGWRAESIHGASVVVVTSHGGCDDGPRAATHETSTTVTITLSTVQHPGNCTAVAYPARLTVRLDEPLGSRQLLGCHPDTAIGEPTAGSDCRSQQP